MNQELKLQAYLDNELPPEEAREVANLLARDREAVALLNTLKATRQAVAQFEAGLRLPESREFYWSRIRRQIEQLEPQAERAPAPSILSTWLRRLLVPASAVAVLVIAGYVATRENPTPQGGSSEEIEMAAAESKAFTYRDYASGMTLVWLSYPPESDTKPSGIEN